MAMAVKRTDNIASDRTSQFAQRANRNSERCVHVRYRAACSRSSAVSLASQSYAQRLDASGNLQKRAIELSSMNEKVRAPEVCGKRERQAKI